MATSDQQMLDEKLARGELNIAAAVDITTLTGKTLHTRRLEHILQTPSLGSGSCVKTYGSQTVCVVCDAIGVNAGAGVLEVAHRMPNCQVEFEQMLAAAEWLCRHGIAPKLGKDAA